MKKIMIASIIALMPAMASAIQIGDQVKATLLDHVTPVNQFAEEGNRVALMDSVILIGSTNGRSILDIQGGIVSDTRPESANEAGINWAAGALLKVSSLLRDDIKFADQYRFLNAIEYGLFINRDFTQEEWRWGAQIGLSFQLQPNE